MGLSKKNFRQKIEQHPLLFFISIHIIIVLGLFTILNYFIYSDPEGLEKWFALNILEGHQLPYRDFISEYPPLTVFTFVVPALFFKTPFAYSIGFAAEILLADIVIVILLFKLAGRLNLRVWEVLGIYTLSLPAIGPLVTTRHDMIPAMLVMAAIYAWAMKKDKMTWVLLGLGTMMKIYPVILAPLFAIYYFWNKQYKDLVRGVILLTAVILVISLPWLVIDAGGYLQFLVYHVERGLHSETSYASILLIGQLLGLTYVKGIHNFGSWNLQSSLADTLANLAPYITAALLCTVFMLFWLAFWRKQKQTLPTPNPDRQAVFLILRYSLLAILIFIIAGKVFSPQYLIWACPFIPLLGRRQWFQTGLLFIIISILTQWVYPYHYLAFEQVEPAPVIIEAFRNILLLVMVFWTVFPGLWFLRMEKPKKHLVFREWKSS